MTRYRRFRASLLPKILVRFSQAILLLTMLQSCSAPGLTEGEGYVDVTGGRVWYEVIGSGPKTPIILLHGGPGATSEYLRPLKELAADRPVIFYDQLGSGKSDHPDNPSLWTTERFVAELGQFREALGLDRVHILGHSWGTMLAADYMLTNPTGVESLILASPCLSAKKWIEDANKLRADLPKRTQEILARHEAAGTTDSEEYMAATMEFYKRHLCRLDPWPAELERAFSDINMQVYGKMWGPSEFYATGTLKDYDRTGDLHKISVPVLFTAGQFDEATPETTAWYQSLIPGAKLKIIQDASHITMIEQPGAYNAVIREFLQGVESD